uniref:DUF559 domain-containing protein n=1 Tax=viral metagenome TaxID=1070528 RepID=A0A6M3XYR6_9ZZZZ
MDMLQMYCKTLRLPIPVTEYRFHQQRRFRFDYAWPITMLAAEIEGGAWTQGRHTRGAGFLKDMEKYNFASILGWSVLRFTPQQVENGEAALKIKEFFDARG